MLLLHGRDRLNGAQDYALAFAVQRQGRAGIQVQPVAKLLRDGDAARCIQSDRGIHRNIVADAAQFCQRIRRAGAVGARLPCSIDPGPYTGYAMSPAPLQLLAYYAGRTKRIQLGTAVIVLPWHDPIRVAEQIALLDIMCGGRCLFGFGRGAASVEYEGFRIPMGEARPRFIEAAQIIKQALAQESFEFHGEYFQIPRTAIRPRPISHPERRFYGTAVSPDSVDVMAKLGFSMLVITQNEWLGAKWESIDNHYHFSDGHLTTVKGYESYEKIGQTYAKMKEPSRQAKATEFYVSIQVVGTPDDCIQKIAELHKLSGLDHLITEFSFGGMPHEEAELGMRLFADKVLPVLQRDMAFAPPQAALAPAPEPMQEGVFAPA